MGVNDTDGLQIGVDNRCSDEFHTAFFQIGGNQIGQRRAGFICFIDSFLLRKMPDILEKTAPFLLNLQKNSGIADGSFNLFPVADDACILHQGLDLCFGVVLDDDWVESIKGLAEVFPLV